MNTLPSYEVWTWIPRYEGRYEISNRGRVRSWVCNSGVTGRLKFTSNPKIKSLFPTKFGYLQTHIGSKILNDCKVCVVHRWVAILFTPNPDDLPEVNHVNGVKKCNEWWNFEWATRMDNIDHAFRTGLIKPALGENQSQTKLTNDQVLSIFNSYKKTSELSSEFSISTHTILDIKRGRTWWHLTGKNRHMKPSDYGRFKQFTNEI